MKNLFFIIMIGSNGFVHSQVGINNTDPKATLDVTAKSTSDSLPDGIIAPRLSGAQITVASFSGLYGTDQTGTIIYATSGTSGTAGTQYEYVTSAGYYYLDSASKWQKFSNLIGGNNGLTQSGNRMQLGGNLINSTTVAQDAYRLSFTATSTNAFSVDGSTFSVDAANNRVGIGTAAPAEALDVNGNANVIGNTTIGGTANVTGDTTIGGNATINGTATIKTTAATTVVNQKLLSVESDGKVSTRFVNYITKQGNALNDQVAAPLGSLITGSFFNNICNDGTSYLKRFTAYCILNYDGTFSSIHTSGPLPVIVTGNGTNTIKFSRSYCTNYTSFIQFSFSGGNITITSDNLVNPATAMYTIR